MTTPFHARVELPCESRLLGVDPQRLELPISEILYRSGIPLNTRCGGQGICNGCDVELIEGAVIDLDTLRPLNVGPPPVRLRACRSRLAPSREIAIRVPARSLAMHAPLATTDFRVRVPFSHEPLFDGQYAAAIDIGTTSVSVAIVNMSNAQLMAVKSAINAQTQWGRDVLSRISACQRDRRTVRALQQAICRKTIRPLIEECLKECPAECHELAGATIAGNTVMLHLVAGEDPSTLGYAPFEPVFTNHRLLTANEIGLECPGLTPDRPIHLLPSASAYIGADIVGGAIATGLAYDEDPSILLDLGTNGEILFKQGARVWACATAAGPAFEGTGLTCGMVASGGAISRVRFNAASAAVELDVIGNESPRGICGSAYIDLLAEGRRVDLIDQIGRLRFADAPEFRSLQECVAGETALRIAVDSDQQPIVLTEGDIALLLQAKAAIAAGIITLLEQCPIDPADVARAFVAGAFGAHVNPGHAVDMGLLPAGFRDRVEAVGNTSLAAAYMVAVDRHILDDLNRFAHEVAVIELNLDERFESRFVDQLFLP